MNENKKGKRNEIEELELEQVTGGVGRIVEERSINPYDSGDEEKQDKKLSIIRK